MQETAPTKLRRNRQIWRVLLHLHQRTDHSLTTYVSQASCFSEVTIVRTSNFGVELVIYYPWVVKKNSHLYLENQQFNSSLRRAARVFDTSNSGPLERYVGNGIWDLVWNDKYFSALRQYADTLNLPPVIA